MEKGSASVRNSLCNSRASLLPPKIPIPATSQSYAEYVGRDHRRTSSECLLIEKPSWFDELLDEPETPVRKGGHRRSSSDSSAYTVGNIVQSSGSAQSLPKADGIPSLASEGKEAAEPATHDSKGSAEKNDSSHGKPSPSETDTKCAKRQFLRPRVRRRQYIAKLEGDVQALEAETSGASAQLEFVKQQNLIIGMENIALKRRIESLAQEQLVKRLEKEALQREVARLRALYLQQQFQRFSYRHM